MSSTLHVDSPTPASTHILRQVEVPSFPPPPPPMQTISEWSIRSSDGVAGHQRGCSFLIPCTTGAPLVDLLQKVGAELISTYILVFTGCGAAMVDVTSKGAITHMGVSMVFGLVVMIMIYSVGHISGAHMNPAVTLAFATVRRFPWNQVLPYIIAQVTASICASFSLQLILGRVAKIGATFPAGSDVQSLALETIISYILMFVVSGVATDTHAVGELAGLAVGAAVTLNAIFVGPISGASMNPARSLGPAVASSYYKSIWVYIVGPVVGCLLGAWSYNLIRLRPTRDTNANNSKTKIFKGCS